MGWQDRSYNRDDPGGTMPMSFAMPRPGPLTISIMTACLLVYVAQSFLRKVAPIEHFGALRFTDSYSWLWRLITYQYLHGNVGHFFFNMLALYFFLPPLEKIWGWPKAFTFYTLGGTAGGLVFGAMQVIAPSMRNSVLIGASGSIFAALGAVALLMPNRQLILLVFPVPIRVAAGLFGAFFLLSALLDGDLSNGAHLGGLAFGFCAPYLTGPILHRAQKKLHRYQLQRAVELEHNEQAIVDRILEKVSHQGMLSLTRGEKKALKQATERQRLADLSREKQWR